MMQLGDIITVKGKSNKGKIRVKLYGDKWEVVAINNQVPCLNGPGVQLESVVDEEAYTRWMALNDDPDFIILSAPHLTRKIEP